MQLRDLSEEAKGACDWLVADDKQEGIRARKNAGIHVAIERVVYGENNPFGDTTTSKRYRTV